MGGRLATAILCLAVSVVGMFTVVHGGAVHAAVASSHAVSVSTAGDDATCARGNVSRPCRTFQRAFEVARPGDSVAVAPGVYPANDSGRGAVTVFGDPRPGAAVSFTCASSGSVEFSAPWFTIKAFGVRVVGKCFRFHSLLIGEPGDDIVTTRDVTIDGAHMEGLEVVGARNVVVRNAEIGPNVYCHAQGTTGTGSAGGPITPAMWCDPNGPPYEAFYAAIGTENLPFQPYIHNNSGNVNPTFTLESSYVHDIQSKDAFNLHTGCGLIWTVSGDPANSIVFRGNRFENCAVQGLQFSFADGVTVTGNWFSYPIEPLSNGLGARTETDKSHREVSIRTEGAWGPRNWLVSFNTFDHGLSLDNSRTNPVYTNVSVRNNLLGRYSYCPAGVTFEGNVFQGSVCGQERVVIPFGYVLGNRKLELDPRKAATVRAIFAAAVKGQPLRDIPKALRQAKLVRLSRSSIRRILLNDFYVGSKVGPPGAHPALVKQSSWRRAQRVAAG